MYIGGLDIGTSGCKIVIYDEHGNFIKSEYKAYEVKRGGGLSEIDPEEILSSVKEIIKRLEISEISAIAITSFGETFAMLDKNDRLCAPSMLYTDPRGKDECYEISNRFGAEKLALKTGTMPHEMYSLSKIMWIKNNRPESFEKAKHILLMQDYIVYMLCGNARIDYSLAARTACFDIKNKCWCKNILEFCGIDENLLSLPVPSGTEAGVMKNNISSELGIKPGTKIVSGCHDQIAAMTGSNVFNSKEAMDGTGTVECVPVVSELLPSDFELFRMGYSFIPHINGKYACCVLSYAGGATIKWFKDNFSELSYSELNKKISDEPTSLLILPHFSGAATPYMDTSSKASIAGLTFEHKAEDIYKALMEGTAFEIKVNLEILKNRGIAPKLMIATGGGARSDEWLQIKADILNIEIAALNRDEAGAAGTAYLAGKATGIYDDNTRLLKTERTFRPCKEKNLYYEKQFKKYKKLYKALKEVMKDE